MRLQVCFNISRCLILLERIPRELKIAIIFPKSPSWHDSVSKLYTVSFYLGQVILLPKNSHYFSMSHKEKVAGLSLAGVNKLQIILDEPSLFNLRIYMSSYAMARHAMQASYFRHPSTTQWGYPRFHPNIAILSTPLFFSTETHCHFNAVDVLITFFHVPLLKSKFREARSLSLCPHCIPVPRRWLLPAGWLTTDWINNKSHREKMNTL